jgi:hypothetical protein
MCLAAPSALAQLSQPCPSEIVEIDEQRGADKAACATPEFGHFVGRPRAEWQDDGRNMVLLESFTYIDPANKKWTSASASTVNGASIPQVLWSIVGGPYEGKYRNASVPHDTECDLKARPWRDVHRMFYYGTRAGGVGWVKGMLMYGAVYFFGPRWPQPSPLVELDGSQAQDFLLRLLVVLRRDTSRSLTFGEVEAKSYSELRIEVPDGDPDLKTVRALLEQKQAARLRPLGAPIVARTVEAIDAQLFLESETTAPPVTIPPPT